MAAFSAFALDDKLKRRGLWMLAAALAAVSLPLGWRLAHFQPAGMDFLPLWTAGRMTWSGGGHVYDFAAVTRAQDWLLPHFRWLRPFAYPPTALLVLAPFGALPFWPALALWLTLSLGLLAFAGARLVRRRRGLALALALASPAMVLCVYCGQTTLIAAALTALALSDLERRPRLAGVWFALAAALKPQAVLLAPVALIAGGAFEALASAVLAGLALVALSIACFGAGRWLEWVGALPAFGAVVAATPALSALVTTPADAARALGLAGLASGAWRAAFALAGGALVWRAFAGRRETAGRLAALAAGSLLATPYALPYDGVLMLPAALALAVGRLDAPGWPNAALALCAVSAITAPPLGLACVLAFALFAGADPAWTRLRPASTAQPA